MSDSHKQIEDIKMKKKERVEEWKWRKYDSCGHVNYGGA